MQHFNTFFLFFSSNFNDISKNSKTFWILSPISYFFSPLESFSLQLEQLWQYFWHFYEISKQKIKKIGKFLQLKIFKNKYALTRNYSEALSYNSSKKWRFSNISSKYSPRYNEEKIHPLKIFIIFAHLKLSQTKQAG